MSPAVKKPAAKKPAAKKQPAAAKKPAAKKQPAAAKKPAAPKKPAPRADLGAPIDGWFAKQPPLQRAIAEVLKKLILEAAPDAASSIKWGMPFFSRGGMMCAIGAHKAHVNLILTGGPGTYDDPKGLLDGDGKTGRHLKILSVEGLPVADVRGWLKTAARHAGSSG